MLKVSALVASTKKARCSAVPVHARPEPAAVAVAVEVEVATAVALALALALAVGDAVDDAVGDGVGSAVISAVGVACDVGVATTGPFVGAAFAQPTTTRTSPSATALLTNVCVFIGCPSSFLNWRRIGAYRGD
jgi:hypothetical protein